MANQRIRRPVTLSPYRLSFLMFIHGLVVVFIALQFYVQVLPGLRPYAYADDWIYAQPLKFSSVSQWVDWAFVQHVDHRIPIQKLTNFWILRATGFDFRYLVALNYLLAIGVTAMLLYVARAYRGYLSAGDLMIPLTLLSFGTGFSLWGFQFQFLSSIFFMTLFVFLGVRFARSGRTGYLSGAAVALIACVLCGMNGLLFAACSTAAMLAWLFVKRTAGTTRPVLLFMAALLIELVIWKAWRPTAASSTDLDLHLIGRYMYSLIPSSMVVFSFHRIFWKFLTIFALFAAALAICLQRVRSRTLTLEEFLLGVGAACSFVVMLSVAVGRSKVQGPWSQGIAMHYGMMSVFMPVLSWILVSKYLSARVSSLVGLALAAVFIASFQANSEWRFENIENSSAHQTEIVRAMQSGESETTIADKYLADFTIDKQHEKDVTGGIDAFRADGAVLYGPRH
jgi:hypothetical protein